ncbi:folate-binding protein YgfZ [Cocleimonas sp. KMM 6892]|uniref:CAF17-like 4Fe-4S cluster assembly/insertion protein YgfZ n=1 Tax=unclassified Cocleimonas TaxID=2639732 RepID=UPI002DBF6C38|nr:MULTISPECIES: folate-binding protein YgfZ [unclassified Cocleimonas]MEB8433002.1 folate-binding protein YgfZ [Cocleimonas sp. KMM 6892]MEC4716017.1 folate-binding protein YgfZ [Cocleimonas sp. KMM 6895]MEC4745478.1 folate-binding protein YgfZ [Cocleimonas sp. KMM 6896]
MNPNWKTFLTEHDALSDDSKNSSYSSDTKVLADLSGRGLLEVSGEDAETFLQNQLTNDIRNVNETTHQESAWCSPKGRIIANFRVFKRGDSFLLDLSADLLEHVIKKLRMYVMMSKVTIDDVSDSLVHFSYSGQGADTELNNILGDLPKAPTESIQSGSLSVLAIAGANTRFDIFGEVEDCKSLWQKLNNDAVVAPSTHWDYLNIQAGIPMISAESTEAWIPQMVNYIHIGGVDFKKGCYPGQEVVARLNYLGKTKRRMYHIVADTASALAVGSAVKSEKDTEAGKVLTSVINPEGKAEALVILKIAEATKPLTVSVDNQEANVHFLDLPYVVEDE